MHLLFLQCLQKFAACMAAPKPNSRGFVKVNKVPGSQRPDLILGESKVGSLDR